MCCFCREERRECSGGIFVIIEEGNVLTEHCTESCVSSPMDEPFRAVGKRNALG